MRLLPVFWMLLLLGACTTDTNNRLKVYQDWSPINISDVEKGIRAHIENESKEKGSFHIENDSLNLDVQLVRVHTEYLSILGPSEFFACVDLATTSGDVYDVDFFMEGTATAMKVTKQDIHKKNGKPFYTWQRRKDNTWTTVPVTGASPNLLGVLEGKDDFIFTYSMVLPEISTNGHIWIPFVQSDRFQTVHEYDLKGLANYQIITDANGINKAIYGKVTPLDAGQQILMSYKVTRLEKSPYREDESNLPDYLDATPLLPIGGRFDSIAQTVIASQQAVDPLMKARALYDYVVDNVRYAKQGKYGTADANFACDAKSGNCTEFHSLFISLARSAGIPARFAVGAAIPSSRNEGGIDGYHCWAEFYAEGKWWPVDISEANKYSALATYYFGHHPANRIEFSKGRDILFTPQPVSGPFAFFAYPYLEIENAQVPLQKTKFEFERIKKG